jgi:hypothetical protein
MTFYIKMKNKEKIFFNKGSKRAQAAVELAIFGSLILLAFSVVLMYGQRLDVQQHVRMEAFRKALQKAYERNGGVSYTLKREGRSFNLFGGFGQGQPSTESSTASVLWQKGMPGPQDNKAGVSYAYYAINDQEIGDKGDGTGLPRYPKQQIDINGHPATVWVTPSIWSEDNLRTEVYSTGIEKQESPRGGINNTRISDLKDTIQTTLRVRVDTAESDTRDPKNPPAPKYVYEGEGYTDPDMGGQTVTSIPAISLGAYARDDINRIDYNPEHYNISTTIHKARSWQTDN